MICGNLQGLIFLFSFVSFIELGKERLSVALGYEIILLAVKFLVDQFRFDRVSVNCSRIFLCQLFQHALGILVFALDGINKIIMLLFIVLSLAPLILLLNNHLDLVILYGVWVHSH